MADRYFCESPVQGPTATLLGSEAQHLARVMRAKPGDRVVLFDGSGAEFAAEVRAVRRDAVECAIIARSETDRELPIPLTLAVALPKGERQRWLIEKAVELGVTCLVPLRTERSVAEASDGALARMRRAVIEASKQCGRNRLLEICEPRTWSELVTSIDPAALRCVAHPGGRPVAEVIWKGTDGTQPVVVAVGPEGGFTDDEISRAKAHGWIAVDLGPRILRVETAATALVASLMSNWSGRVPDPN